LAHGRNQSKKIKMLNLNNNTLREKVADSIRESIIKGDLRPGERLQEVELAAEYKTSRTPVREALRQLESEGFLVIKPRRGAVVAPITAKDIHEFYEMKSVLEGFAARQATEKLSELEISRMEELNSELRQCYEKSDIASMVPVHNEFHEIFVNAAGNEQLASLIRSLVKRFQRYRIALSHTSAIEESIAMHDQIVSAFRERDSEKASYLVAKNSSEGSEALMRRLPLAGV